MLTAAKRRAIESAEAARSQAKTPQAVALLIVAEAGRFALFAGLAGVLAAAGVAALMLAALVAILYGWPWLFVVAGALLAAAGVLGRRLAIRLLAWKEVLVRPRKRDQVFISYRTNEHAEVATEAARILEQHALGSFLARPGTMTKGPDHPLGGFQALKLFQAGGLDADLQRALIASDSILFFVPVTESRPGYIERFRDTADTVIAMVLFFSGLSRTFWRFVWYASIYGRGLMPRLTTQLDRRSWQDWELAIARQLGLPLVKVGVQPRPGGADDEDLIECPRESFADSFAARVVPRLSAAVREELRVSPTVPQVVGGVLVYAVAALALMLTFLAVALLLLLYFAGTLALVLTLLAVALVLLVRALVG
jgi:hypothetical protein